MTCHRECESARYAADQNQKEKREKKSPEIVGDGGEEGCIPVSRHLSCRRKTYKDSFSTQVV